MDGSKQASRTNSFEIENLLKTAEQVTGICRSPGETRKSSPTGSVLSSHSQAMTPSRQLTDAEKLKKVILELIDTERTYVKVRASLAFMNFLLRSMLFMYTYIVCALDDSSLRRLFFAKLRDSAIKFPTLPTKSSRLPIT